jgi:Flp pilus assembly pilin Flp
MKNPAANTTTRIDLRLERGQTMAEYGVIIALITLAVVSAFALLNAAALGMLGRVAGYLGG